MASTVSVGFRADYTPSSDVAVGAVVVQNTLVGIADRPLPANKLGSLAVYGTFTFPKATGASTAMAAGIAVYWDATNQKATATSTSNNLMGKTVAAAVDADATVLVLLRP